MKEEERAALVLAALPECQLQSVGHLLGVGNDPYTQLKKQLVEVDAPSFQESLELLLACCPSLLDRDPPTSTVR